MKSIDFTKILITPITNEQEFKQANDIIESLIDVDLMPNSKSKKQALKILEAITILAIEYEKKHYSIPKPKPIEAIKEKMNQLKLSQKQLAPLFGGENRVSEVLSGKRKLTLNMIRKIHKNMGIPTDTLLEV